MSITCLPVNRDDAAREARHLVTMAGFGLLNSPAVLELPTSAQEWQQTESAWEVLSEAKACYDLVISGGCKNEL